MNTVKDTKSAFQITGATLLTEIGRMFDKDPKRTWESLEEFGIRKPAEALPTTDPAELRELATQYADAAMRLEREACERAGVRVFDVSPPSHRGGPYPVYVIGHRSSGGLFATPVTETCHTDTVVGTVWHGETGPNGERVRHECIALATFGCGPFTENGREFNRYIEIV